MTSRREDNALPYQYRRMAIYKPKVVKEYRGLTLKQLDLVNDLALDVISEAEVTRKDYLYLEQRSLDYGYMSRYETYYVRSYGEYLGKVCISLLDTGDDHYDLTLIYYTRKFKVPRPQGFYETHPYGYTEADKKAQERVKRRIKKRNERINKNKWGQKTE